MAINDLTRSEIKALKQRGENSINSCKNNLTSIIDSVDGVTSAHLDRLGYTATEKTELTNLKTKLIAIRDKIVDEGF